MYDCSANRERRRRAAVIGERIGATAAQVAVAWVLHQPFPTFAVVGASRVDHLEAHAGAADLELTPEDVAWLAAVDEEVPA